MIVHLNGEPHELADGMTVGGVLDLLDVPQRRRGVAVAVGSEVVPRGEWDERTLQEGDRVEVVAAIQGG